MDKDIIDKIDEIMNRLLTLMGEEAEITCAAEEETITVDIRCEKAGQLIGKGGKALEALQHIVYKLAGRALLGRDIEAIVIDIDGYRKKREEELSIMAGEIAERVSSSGKSELLQPMSAWERKIVHKAVQKSEDLESESEDTAVGRRVRIRPKGKSSA
jgi:spoIIIJ-associated protein